MRLTGLIMALIFLHGCGTAQDTSIGRFRNMESAQMLKIEKIKRAHEIYLIDWKHANEYVVKQKARGVNNQKITLDTNKLIDYYYRCLMEMIKQAHREHDNRIR